MSRHWKLRLRRMMMGISSWPRVTPVVGGIYVVVILVPRGVVTFVKHYFHSYYKCIYYYFVSDRKSMRRLSKSIIPTSIAILLAAVVVRIIIIIIIYYYHSSSTEKSCVVLMIHIFNSFFTSARLSQCIRVQTLMMDRRRTRYGC